MHGYCIEWRVDTHYEETVLMRGHNLSNFEQPSHVHIDASTVGIRDWSTRAAMSAEVCRRCRYSIVYTSMSIDRLRPAVCPSSVASVLPSSRTCPGEAGLLSSQPAFMLSEDTSKDFSSLSFLSERSSIVWRHWRCRCVAGVVLSV